VTATTIRASLRHLPDGTLRLPLQPAEGWLTLVSTAVMVMALGGSLQEAGWTPDAKRGAANFLPWVGLIGVAFGVAGAKVGWGRWRTHIVGALFAGLLLPLIMGGIALGPDADVGWDPHSLALRLVAALDVMQHVWSDLAVQGRPVTGQWSHYHLVFGTLVWGAGMLAGFSVFGHRRPLDAVVVVGLAILANMALTSHDQMSLLVLFSAAALLLLIRTHVFEEELTWARRKIGDPGTVGQLYLRGGAAFVTAAVLGSILLTATASSAPLQGVWADLPQHLQNLSQFIARFAPNAGDPRPLGIVGFGENATTLGLWQPVNATAFRAQFEVGEGASFKWRAGTYAQYTGFGWTWGSPQTRTEIAARDSLPDGVGEPNKAIGRREVRFRILPDAFRLPTVLGPNEVRWVDRAARETTVGDGRYFASLDLAESSGAYAVLGMVPVLNDVQGGITEARLRAAGTDYPTDLRTTYTTLPDNAVGPEARKLLAAIRATVVPPPGVDPNNPYDLVRRMESYLNDPDRFAYDSDVRDERDARCGDISSVECFAVIKRGYCEYYASTMAVLLREAKIPARIAYGFLPTERGPDNLEVVNAQGAHWWVEVFFPGTGWVEFDPTGQVGQPLPIPSGSIGPATPRPTFAVPTPRDEPDETADARNPVGGFNGGTGIGPFIAIAIILVIGVGALAWAAMRRTPTKPMHPDRAWGSLARLAARLGLGPRPSQTVYEYAGALGDEVPAVRVELTTLARAKVEVAYGKRDLGADRLRRIAEAYQKLRLALIGLVLRRGLRRARRR
jgi:hypothetical protein